MIVNQTQPVLLSQPILKCKHTIYQLILDKNYVIVTPCSVSLAIRQSPYTKGYLTQHWKPPRFKG